MVSRQLKQRGAGQKSFFLAKNNKKKKNHKTTNANKKPLKEKIATKQKILLGPKEKTKTGRFTDVTLEIRLAARPTAKNLSQKRKRGKNKEISPWERNNPMKKKGKKQITGPTPGGEKRKKSRGSTTERGKEVAPVGGGGGAGTVKGKKKTWPFSQEEGRGRRTVLGSKNSPKSIPPKKKVMNIKQQVGRTAYEQKKKSGYKENPREEVKKAEKKWGRR